MSKSKLTIKLKNQIVKTVVSSPLAARLPEAVASSYGQGGIAPGWERTKVRGMFIIEAFFSYQFVINVLGLS